VLLTIATVAVLGFFGVRLAGAARLSLRHGPARQQVATIVRGIRLRHLWPVPFVLTAVIAAALLLVQLPVLSFGWWSAIGGVGNPVAGSTEQTAGTPLEWIVPLVFVTLLLPALPLFAMREEEMFRLGAERWSWPRRAYKAVQFGLVHVIIGIPIGVALALSIGGAYFQYAYLREFRRSHLHTEALLESTRAHTAYNGVIIGFVLFAVVVTVALGPSA
jgi:hypothetical protein